MKFSFRADVTGDHSAILCRLARIEVDNEEGGPGHGEGGPAKIEYHIQFSGSYADAFYSVWHNMPASQSGVLGSVPFTMSLTEVIDEDA